MKVSALIATGLFALAGPARSAQALVSGSAFKPHNAAGSFAIGRSSSFLTRGGRTAASHSTAAAAAPRMMALAFPDMTYNPDPEVAITAAATAPVDFDGDLLVLPFYQVESEDKEATVALEGAAAALDAKLGGALAALVARHSFAGKAGSSALARAAPGSPAVALVGLGKKGEAVAAFDKLGAHVAATAAAEKAAAVGVALGGLEGVTAAQAQAAAEALVAALYKDKRYRDTKEDKPDPLASVALLGLEGEAAGGLARGAKVALGINFARDLVNAPPNYCRPQTLAQAAERVAAEAGLEVEILDEAQCEALGMGAYLGVAQGAVNPAHFIHLTYRPEGEAKKKVALIGKGLTFDSGGYNIKAGAGSMIEMMKFDMGGSAATLGAARAVGALKPAGVEVHFIVAACENMVSDKAMRPGDILTASNGKTIEVLNTDAEGRLTLADALVFAENLGDMDAIVDSATLTGACIVALGPQYAGLWSSDDTLAEELKASAQETGEKLWQMPLAAESYAEDIKSKFADVKNIGGKGGGSITAALFLKEFVKDTPWAHIDLAGPVWSDKAGGATGYGVRTLTKWVEKQSEK